MAKVKIFVTAKKGVLDPVGKTVGAALHSLGYKKVGKVGIGKYIELDFDAKGLADKEINKTIEEMCKKLLSNPVIEDYRYEVAK